MQGTPTAPTIDISENPLDRITQEEFAALEELKKHEISKGIPDKVLLVFLFARKLDVKRTISLLTLNMQFMKEYGYSWNVPITASEVDPRLLKNPFAFSLPGNRDKLGRKISYLFPARLRMKDFTFKQIMDFTMFSFYEYLKEGLDVHRAGVTYIEDIKGMQMKNIDMNMANKMNKNVKDTFPLKIKLILVVNPGTLIKVLLAIARVFVKKKVMERVKIVDKTEELTQFVELDQLPKCFGGKLEIPDQVYPISE